MKPDLYQAKVELQSRTFIRYDCKLNKTTIVLNLIDYELCIGNKVHLFEVRHVLQFLGNITDQAMPHFD